MICFKYRMAAQYVQQVGLNDSPESDLFSLMFEKTKHTNINIMNVNLLLFNNGYVVII